MSGSVGSQQRTMLDIKEDMKLWTAAHRQRVAKTGGGRGEHERTAAVDGAARVRVI